MEYLLLGMGISNLSIAKFFERKKVKYYWFDDSIEVREKVILEYPYLKDKVYQDDNNKRVVIKSGGISNNHPLIKKARVIISDLEFYYLYNNANKKITVTGTNGKSTCVTLIKELIRDIDLGGNIGIPLGDLIESNNDIVIEASSYMLEYIKLYHSKYNIILNICPNHLDHHITMENYISSKMNLFKNCSNNDYIIYNYDDKIVKEAINQLHTKARLIPVSINSKVDGIYIMNDYIYLFDKPIIHTSEVNLSEVYYIDVLSSILVSYLYGVSIYDIRERLHFYKPLRFRLEKLSNNKPIIYNDSKATNIGSLYRALKAISKIHRDKSITLVCGGQKRDNMIITDDLNNYSFEIDNLKKIITFGSSSQELDTYFREKLKDKDLEILRYDKLKDMDLCKLENEEVILFSPGCPSFDEFTSYEERGKYFELFVQKYLKN